jgi:hypothetical protein
MLEHLGGETTGEKWSMLIFVVRVVTPSMGGGDAIREFYVVCAQNERDAVATLHIRLGLAAKQVDAIKAQPADLCDFLDLKEGQILHWVAIA